MQPNRLYYLKMHQKLFSQIDLQARPLKNRVIAHVPPTYLASAGGAVTSQLADYYERIAATDVAMVITEAAAVDSNRNHHLMLGGNENESVQGLSRLTERVRAYGSQPILQLFHPGINAAAPLVYGPSALQQPRIQAQIHELNYDRIRAISSCYLEASISAWNAGFAGIEINAADGSLIQQFLSPLTNLRKDDFGYQLNAGSKFSIEIVKAIRKAIVDFIIIVRISIRDLLPAGKSIEDSLKFISLLEAAGISALHLTSGLVIGPPDFHHPAGKSAPDAAFAGDARIIRHHTRLPLILSGKIATPDLAESLLDDNTADAVSLGRTLNRDLQWLEKGRIISDIVKVRPCLRCPVCSAARFGCPDMGGIPLWNLNLQKYLKGKKR